MIKESKITGNYYHFVDTEVLNYLSDKDFNFKLHKNDYKQEKYPYALSLTRSYNFEWTNYRITFDSFKLSTKYKVSPFHYFNNTDRIDFDFKGDHRYPYDEEGTYSGNEAHFDNQYEERLLSKKEIINLKDCIIQIDILNYDRQVMDYVSFFNKNEILKLKHKIEEQNEIIVNIVNKFQPIK